VERELPYLARMDTGFAPARAPLIAYCEERRRLLNEFTAAVQDLVLLQDQQIATLINGDEEFTRFDILLHRANDRKQLAKYSYISHLEAHGCGTPKELRTP
jgi:hypothetical protein